MRAALASLDKKDKSEQSGNNSLAIQMNRVAKAGKKVPDPVKKPAEHSTHSTGAKRAELRNGGIFLIPLECLEELGKLYEFGAEKYDPRNWEGGLPQKDLATHCATHLHKYMEGEDLDDESKLLQTAHIAWNAIALLHHQIHNLEDNRDKRAKYVTETDGNSA